MSVSMPAFGTIPIHWLVLSGDKQNKQYTTEKDFINGILHSFTKAFE